MAKWQARKSKKIGPLRVTASKRGLSVSGGVKGARVSANTRGEVHRTTSIPGTGIYKRQKLGGGKKPSHASTSRRQAGVASTQIEMEVIDATGGDRRLLDGDPDVETLDVVGLREHLGDVAAVAAKAGLSDSKPQAIRDALLIRVGDRVKVLLTITVDDNASLFTRKQKRSGMPIGVEIGRLSAKAAKRLAELAGVSDVRAVAFIDARPMREHIEVRLRPSEFVDEPEDEAPRPADSPPPAPPVPADWYPDPHGEKRLRYFDGQNWTSHTAD